MAITVTKANFPMAQYRVLLLAGYQNQDFDFAKIKEDAPFSLDDVKEAIYLSTAELSLILVDTLDHPYRNFYFTETPVSLSYGDRIPVAVGPHSKVSVTYPDPTLPEDPGTPITVFGTLARNKQHVDCCRMSPDVYGPGLGLYWIENGHLFFVGTSAAVHSPTIEVNRSTISSTGLLPIPDVYVNAVIAGAFRMLYMQGQDVNQRAFYIEQADRFYAKVQGKDLDLPEPERFKQLNN